MSTCQVVGVVHVGGVLDPLAECGAPAKYRAAAYTYTAPAGDYLPLEVFACDDHLSPAVDVIAAQVSTVIAVRVLSRSEATQ